MVNYFGVFVLPAVNAALSFDINRSKPSQKPIGYGTKYTETEI